MSEEDFKEQFSRPAADKRARDIRQRTVDGIEDLALLTACLDPDEREKIADELGLRREERIQGAHLPVPNNIVNAIAFIYHLHEDSDQFRQSVMRAIANVERDRADAPLLRQSIDVSIDIEQVERTDLETLRDVIDKEGATSLSTQDKQLLLELTDDDLLMDALDRQITPPSTHPDDRENFEWP